MLIILELKPFSIMFSSQKRSLFIVRLNLWFGRTVQVLLFSSIRSFRSVLTLFLTESACTHTHTHMVECISQLDRTYQISACQSHRQWGREEEEREDRKRKTTYF